MGLFCFEGPYPCILCGCRPCNKSCSQHSLSAPGTEHNSGNDTRGDVSRRACFKRQPGECGRGPRNSLISKVQGTFRHTSRRQHPVPAVVAKRGCLAQHEQHGPSAARYPALVRNLCACLLLPAVAFFLRPRPPDDMSCMWIVSRAAPNNNAVACACRASNDLARVGSTRKSTDYTYSSSPSANNYGSSLGKSPSLAKAGSLMRPGLEEKDVTGSGRIGAGGWW